MLSFFHHEYVHINATYKYVNIRMIDKNETETETETDTLR